MRIILATFLLLAVTEMTSGQTYRPAFRPEALKPTLPGTPNQVLILGSPHLSEAPSGFSKTMLAPLLDRLAGWQPNAIATEDLSGLQCEALRRYPTRYAETVQTYCQDTSVPARITGLDVPAANVEAERLLADWPIRPSPAQRRHLAAVFLAAGERNSALVQWVRLPAAERRPEDGLNRELIGMLAELQTKHNESGLVGAALAAQLGLERVWGIDDHSADALDGPNDVERNAYAVAIAKAWDNPSTRQWQTEAKRLVDRMTSPDGVLEAYRGLNAPGIAMLAFQGDARPALTETSPQHFGRGYVGYWETRNLRMSANIRDVLARSPGTKMLVIVGATHKAYLEAYLDQMLDVRLRDVEVVLR